MRLGGAQNRHSPQRQLAGGQAAVIQRILGHLGLPTEIPVSRPARAPPLPIDRDACPLANDLGS